MRSLPNYYRESIEAMQAIAEAKQRGHELGATVALLKAAAVWKAWKLPPPAARDAAAHARLAATRAPQVLADAGVTLLYLEPTSAEMAGDDDDAGASMGEGAAVTRAPEPERVGVRVAAGAGAGAGAAARGGVSCAWRLPRSGGTVHAASN